jgi:hypothetical protein
LRLALNTKSIYTYCQRETLYKNTRDTWTHLSLPPKHLFQRVTDHNSNIKGLSFKSSNPKNFQTMLTF